MPNLAPVVDSLDQVPEPARQFYVQKEGKFHVDLAAPPAGFVPASDLAAANGRIVEFRDNNIRLTQEVEQLRPIKTQFEGIDPVAAKEALADRAKLKDKGVTKADDITNLVTQAVAAAVKPLQDQVAASQATIESERKRADELVLRTQVQEKFIKAGGKPKAVDFAIGQAASVFKVENGAIVAQPNKFSAVRPGEPLGIDEWIVNLSKENDFVFEASNGSGAAPVKGALNARPGQTVVTDPTPQQLGQYASDIKSGKVRVEYTAK